MDINKNGVYLNTSKNGCNYDIRKKVCISPDESKRETSVSSILAELGFEVPEDVIMYANRPDIVSTDPCNAYTLASLGMNGEQIFSLCNELRERGENLKDAVLDEEQITRYGVKKYKEDLENKIKNIEKHIKYITIGHKKIAIYEGEDDFAPYIAYNNDCNICINISLHELKSKKGNIKKRGVTFAIQSNPKKSDLPPELIYWAIKLTQKELVKGATTKEGLKNVNDVLIKNTRIIYGCDVRPDVFLENWTVDEVLYEIINEINKSVIRENEPIWTEIVDINSIRALLQDIRGNNIEII